VIAPEQIRFDSLSHRQGAASLPDAHTAQVQTGQTMTQQPRYIRIIATPPGEAPLWVREKWIGLELPLVDGDSAAQEVFTSGVLSGPRNRFLSIIWGL
jgi:hypothetical protein